MHFPALYHLGYFGEGFGELLKLVKQDGILIGQIGKIHLALPMSLEQDLRPLIGQRIAIIRTDLPQEEYIIRVLTEETEREENDGEGG